MAEWVRLCGATEAPEAGHVVETHAGETAICLANLGGVLSALDNICPHRRGPLGQGWIEGRAVVCPWHSWSFDLTTGIAEYPEKEQVAVFPVKVQDGEVLVQLG